MSSPRATVRSYPNTPKRDCKPNFTRNHLVPPLVRSSQNTPKRNRQLSREISGAIPNCVRKNRGHLHKGLVKHWGSSHAFIFRDFYDNFLSHLPLRKLKELEIWGNGTAKCPYDGYIPIQISFGPSVVGNVEAFDTLAVICPRPSGGRTELDTSWNEY